MMSAGRLVAAAFGIATISTVVLTGAASADGPEVKSDPPGFCEPFEEGVAKIGPDNYLYVCSYVPGEGFLWIPGAR